MKSTTQKNTTREMTTGSPLRLIVQFALPVLGGNLLQQMYNMIDAAIVGRFLGAPALAAVGSTSSVQFLVFGFCIGTCSGFGVPIARDFGAHNMAKMRREIFHSFLLTAVIALIGCLGCSLGCTGILRMMQVPEDIWKDAYLYLLIIFLGTPFTLLYNLLSGILRSVGDSRTPFLFLALSTVLNIFLDIFCIVVLKWGCAGAAIATVAAQAISGLLCLVVIVRSFQVLHPRKEDRRFQWSCIHELLTMGVPMGLQFSITAIGSMVLQTAVNAMGSVYVSAFTTAIKINQISMCPIDAVANATSVFSSQNLGAGKPDRIRRGMFEGVLAGVVYGLVAGIVLYLFGHKLCLLFVSADNTEVISLASRLMRYNGFAFWLLGILTTVRLCVQGLGFPGRAVFSGVMEMIARAGVVFLLVPSLHFTAVCMANIFAWAFGALYIGPVGMLTLRQVQKKLKQ